MSSKRVGRLQISLKAIQNLFKLPGILTRAYQTLEMEQRGVFELHIVDDSLPPVPEASLYPLVVPVYRKIGDTEAFEFDHWEAVKPPTKEEDKQNE